MNKKQWLITVSILTIFLGCEMDYESFKSNFFNGSKELEVKSEYGVIDGVAITKEDILLAQDLLDIKDEFTTLDKKLKKEIIDVIVEKKLLSHYSVSALKEDISFNQKLEQIKDELALNMWIEKETVKLEKKIKEADLETFYKKNKDLFLIPEQFKLRHIVLKSEKDSIDVFKKLEDKNSTLEDFSNMAKTKSIDSTSELGGDLGWLELEGLLPEVKKIIKDMKKNSMVRLKEKTALGFHIFYLEDKNESTYMNVESVKEDIKSILLKEKIDKLMSQTVDKLKKSAKIDLK